MAEQYRMSTQGKDESKALYGPKAAPEPTAQTARGRYEELKSDRDGYLRRARAGAKLTVPSLFPDEGVSGSTDLPTPWQSVGAKGLLGLTAKLLLALFPAGQTWFKQQPTRKVIAQLEAHLGASTQEFIDAKTALEGELANQERDVVDSLEAAGFRPVMNEALKQILLAGNVLVQMNDNGTINVHRLDRFVVCRDCDGNVLDIVLHQRLDKRALPQAALAVYVAHKDEEDDSKREVDIYTWLQRDPIRPNIYRVCQEILGVIVPGSEGLWPVDKTPIYAVAINRIPGEAYGRGHIEMFIGDLISHDSLSQSTVEGLAALVRTIILVDEGGVTDRKKIANANNGDVLPGREEDVHVLQSEKSVDLQVARVALNDIAMRLSEAFLDASSIQRDAERVTAEEIRLLAQQLDNSFGGIYSLLAVELQYRLAARRIFVMQRAGEIARLPQKSVKTVIVAGFAALGRSSDLQRLIGVMQAANEVLQPNSPVSEYTNTGDLLQRLSTAGGVEAKGLFKTEQEVATNRQAANARELAGKVGPQVVKTQGDLAMHSTPPAGAEGDAAGNS